MPLKILRVLIVEDTPERQEILRNLYKDHAWILVNTAERAIRLLAVYHFDLISLDYDLGGVTKGDKVASAILKSTNSGAKVIVHAMNAQGAKRILQLLPQADIVPLSKFTKNNATFKRLCQELSRGVNINWAFVFGKREP